ncbi:MAG: nitroreductase family protein [Acidimicrobiia bacterium]|jgi:nitroreductase
METWDAIRSRRNVRTYTDEPIDEEDLARILEAARLTPSSSNSQPWDFVVCTNRDQLEKLSQVWKGASHVARSAATIALVAPRSNQESAQYDLGQATMSIMLEAADLGIGSGHAFVSDHDLAAVILNIPEDHICLWLVALGYPADRPLTPIAKPARRPFEEVVHRDRW